MFIQIIFLFLLNFIVLFFFGKYLGASGSFIFLSFNFFLIVLKLFGLVWFFLKNTGIYVYATGFYFSDFLYSFNEWIFMIDSITLVMLVVVCIISILVHYYSMSYMQFDPHLVRFMSLLSLFTFCMLILVTSSNFIQLFFGWEGVGICSYLLVNFWFTRIQANKSALKAMLMNRFGDISLLIAISLYYYVFRTFDFSIGFMLVESYKFSYMYFVFDKFHFISLFSFFLLIAAVGKSAQLGLHTWLPDAMEGPTPVSALIHAATMVTAGIFLIIRMSIFFEYSFISSYVLLIGGITALFGSLVAVLQNDIKRVIAYSTCSQLGYMMVACGLFRYDLALFHLFNHAFFKALLFLASGVVLHALSNEQDMRKMGGLFLYLPFTYVCILLGSYALMGLPFLSGFYSKDVILELAFFYYDTDTAVTFWLIIFAAFFTAVYSFRLIYLVFFGRPKGFFVFYKNVEEGDHLTLAVLSVLSFLSLFVGYLFKDLFIGVGSYFINIPVKPVSFNIFFDNEMMEYRHKLLPLFFSLFGLYLGYFYLRKPTDDERFYMFSDLYRFIASRWYFDFIYNYYFVYFIQFFSYSISYKLLDRNLFEVFGARGVFSFSLTASSFYSFFYNSGYLYMEIFLLILSMLSLFLVSFFIGVNKCMIYIYLIYLYIIFIFGEENDDDD